MLSKQNLFGKRESPAPLPSRPSTTGAPTGSAAAGSGSGQAGEASAHSFASSPAKPGEPATKEKSVVDKPAPVAESIGGARLVVGPDVKLKGAEIADCDTLVVEGRVEATMDSRVIQIAEKGAFSGKVGIDVAEIHGVFEGELTARQRLVVHATGRVSGKIRYGKILVEEGGEISGDIRALSAGEEAAKDNPGIARVKPFVADSATG
jgi:cytoskeletal protein CcmA (bactofilin family)